MSLKKYFRASSLFAHLFSAHDQLPIPSSQLGPVIFVLSIYFFISFFGKRLSASYSVLSLSILIPVYTEPSLASLY